MKRRSFLAGIFGSVMSLICSPFKARAVESHKLRMENHKVRISEDGYSGEVIIVTEGVLEGVIWDDVLKIREDILSTKIFPIPKEYRRVSLVLTGLEPGKIKYTIVDELKPHRLVF